MTLLTKSPTYLDIYLSATNLSFDNVNTKSSSHDTIN